MWLNSGMSNFKIVDLYSLKLELLVEQLHQPGRLLNTPLSLDRCQSWLHVVRLIGWDTKYMANGMRMLVCEDGIFMEEEGLFEHFAFLGHPGVTASQLLGAFTLLTVPGEPLEQHCGHLAAIYFSLQLLHCSFSFHLVEGMSQLEYDEVPVHHPRESAVVAIALESLILYLKSVVSL